MISHNAHMTHRNNAHTTGTEDTREYIANDFTAFPCPSAFPIEVAVVTRNRYRSFADRTDSVVAANIEMLHTQYCSEGMCQPGMGTVVGEDMTVEGMMRVMCRNETAEDMLVVVVDMLVVVVGGRGLNIAVAVSGTGWRH